MTIAQKYAQQYMPNGEVSLEQVIQAAIDEQAETHAIELRAYEATVQNLEERIRQMGTERVPDVDWLSNVIRHADGSHTLGAGQLAEKIVDAMLAAAPQPKKEGE